MLKFITLENLDQCFKGQSAHAYNRNVAFRLGMFHVGWMGALQTGEFKLWRCYVLHIAATMYTDFVSSLDLELLTSLKDLLETFAT
jgi:hypothetical protein